MMFPVTPAQRQMGANHGYPETFSELLSHLLHDGPSSGVVKGELSKLFDLLVWLMVDSRGHVILLISVPSMTSTRTLFSNMNSKPFVMDSGTE